jgi:glycerol-3-phosphate dehydrogenase (NAD(P)+)
MFSIAVVGAGAFGTSLGRMLSGKGFGVRMWAHEPAVADKINTLHENPLYLAGFRLPESVRASARMDVVLDGADLVLLVTPSQFVRSVAQLMAPLLRVGPPIVCAAKGIEARTCMTMNEVLEEVLPADHIPHLAFLSGPSFARELAQELPTAVSIAARVEENAKRVQHIFATPFFRTYHTQDVVGVEVGGATKNVIAIAAGISDGLGLGLNARAALITRGLAEIARLALAKGASPMTLAGLAGIGDLVVTCTGDLSRNRTLGVRLGRGMSLREALGGSRSVVEGVETAASVTALAARVHVELPICEQVCKILFEGKPAHQGLVDLMSRGLKGENETLMAMHP